MPRQGVQCCSFFIYVQLTAQNLLWLCRDPVLGDCVQVPSDADQRSLLEAVIKVLWRVTASDEEEPDCRAAIDAMLHLSASQDLSAESPKAKNAGEKIAPTSPPRTTAHIDAGARTPGGGPQIQGGHLKKGAETQERKMVWPQVNVEFWQRVESMLDVRAGCAIVEHTEFAGWVSSVLQCRPALADSH
jgi:hypothetical protein